jgi:hypothetical protein
LNKKNKRKKKKSLENFISEDWNGY